jgi:hypothetical protein
VKVWQELFTVYKNVMVIQSTADTGQIPVQLLTLITVFLLAAASMLLSKTKNAGGDLKAEKESEA